MTDLCVGTRVEKTAAGEARAALVSQMATRLTITQVRPFLGASGRTMAFLRSILRERRNIVFALFLLFGAFLGQFLDTNAEANTMKPSLMASKVKTEQDTVR